MRCEVHSGLVFLFEAPAGDAYTRSCARAPTDVQPGLFPPLLLSSASTSSDFELAMVLTGWPSHKSLARRAVR